MAQLERNEIPDVSERDLRRYVRELREETGYVAREWARAGVLHPVLAGQHAADPLVRQAARYNPLNGEFEIPARSAVVFVVKGPQP